MANVRDTREGSPDTPLHVGGSHREVESPRSPTPEEEYTSAASIKESQLPYCGTFGNDDLSGGYYNDYIDEPSLDSVSIRDELEAAEKEELELRAANAEAAPATTTDNAGTQLTTDIDEYYRDNLKEDMDRMRALGAASPLTANNYVWLIRKLVNGSPPKLKLMDSLRDRGEVEDQQRMMIAARHVLYDAARGFSTIIDGARNMKLPMWFVVPHAYQLINHAGAEAFPTAFVDEVDALIEALRCYPDL